MSLINERELRQSVKSLGAEQTSKNLKEALKKGELKPADFSIKALFENLVTDKNGNPVGREAIDEMRQAEMTGEKLNENLSTLVSLSTFSNTTGQIFYNEILDAYKLAACTVTPLLGVVPSSVLGVEEKFAGISNLGNAFNTVVPEGQPFPMVSLSEDWINTQKQTTKGGIVPVTRQAVIGDRTGELLLHCQQTGEAIAIGREIDAVDALIANGGSSDPAAYRWRGTSYAPYQTSATNSPYYKNVIGSNQLVNQKNIDSCYQALAAIIDPLTGQPLSDPAEFTLLVTPENRYTAGTIQFSQGIWNTPVGSFANVAGGQSVVPFSVVVSKYLATRLTNVSQATSNWYFGDFKRGLKFVRAMDITVSEAAPNSGLLFTNDIVAMFKAMRLESVGWFQPRVVAKNTVA